MQAGLSPRAEAYRPHSPEIDRAPLANVYSGSTLIASGQAGGPANPFHDTQSTFAPEAQAGYFSHFANSSWLWGVKFRYKYLGVTSTDRLADSPQTGSFTNTGAAPAATSFTGNVVIQSSQTRLNHELAFLAFLGHSFANTNVYLGAGPALFGTNPISIMPSATRTTARTSISPARRSIIPAPTGCGEPPCKSA